MKDIAIFGAGGFGREIACMIRNNFTEWNIVGYFDDGIEKGTSISPFGEVLGGIDELNSWEDELAVAFAIGNPNTVRILVGKVNNPKISYPNIIHPNFKILDEETFSIGKGNIITSDCRVSCNVSIGDFNAFNGSVVLGHDAKIGSYNSFMPAVRISGEVKIGDCNFFGVASIVLQQLRVGNEVKLGAGSVLMTKPKDGNLYIGVPAKKNRFINIIVTLNLEQ